MNMVVIEVKCRKARILILCMQISFQRNRKKQAEKENKLEEPKNKPQTAEKKKEATKPSEKESAPEAKKLSQRPAPEATRQKRLEFR